MDANVRRHGIDGRLFGQLLVGVLVGAGLATMFGGESVSLPLLGAVSGVVVGGAGVVVGTALYTRLPGCGCGGCGGSGGECDCDDACSR